MDFFTALKGRDDYCPHSPDEETEAQGTTRLLVEGRLVRGSHCGCHCPVLGRASSFRTGWGLQGRTGMSPRRTSCELPRPVPTGASCPKGKPEEDRQGDAPTRLPGRARLQERPDLLQTVSFHLLLVRQTPRGNRR